MAKKHKVWGKGLCTRMSPRMKMRRGLSIEDSKEETSANDRRRNVSLLVLNSSREAKVVGFVL